MFQGTADQNVPVAARNRVAPLGQDHAWQKVFGALVQNHLALDRLNRQFQAQWAQQVTAPGAGGQHHVIGRYVTSNGLHAPDAFAVTQKASHFAVLPERDVGHGLQRCLEGLDQPRVAYIGHIGHVDGPAETRAQHRHRVVGCRHIHRFERPAFAGCPIQGLLLIFKVEPVKAGGMHFRVQPSSTEQALAQLWIKVLGPMRQGSNG
ncbi:hypothetical protein D3C76_907150 [compost metagenome]